MLDAIQRFFKNHMQDEARAITDRAATPHALRVATAAVLVEAMRADSQVSAEEREALQGALGAKFELPPDEVRELIALAEQEAAVATSLYQFTHLIDKGFSHEQKTRVVELLWQVAFADGHLEAREEAVVRRVADLIHVPHKTYVDAKIRARAEAPDPGKSE
ncbi:MAG: TerB family tellurite resistance protein [Nitrospirota bacterium]|nr:TerB family tellurite resistance protein [Nitrospirota bacterium]